MAIQITNSLTGKKETFVPMEEGHVRMYVCGPTVYGLTHIGNARPAVFFDVVRRYLEFSGYQVNFVSNFTDVDDKIINRAREMKQSALEVSEHFTAEFQKDMEALGVRPPNSAPKVTEHMPEILRFIEGLIARGMAYVVDGEVFYSVRKFKGYGKLSGKNIDDLLVGARVQPDEKKQDPLDFSLWKPQKATDEPAWESPWGKGRPGWHIECSAMAFRYLGETFDIHGGGIDLLHPHHENEIAQSEGLFEKTFAKLWMHNNLVTTNAEKMSKSLGNIFLNRDFTAKYTAETLKFLLLSGHYRSPIDFSERHIRESQAALHRVYSTMKKCSQLLTFPRGPHAQPTSAENDLFAIDKTFFDRWRQAMDDDFNSAKVIGFVFEYVRALNGYLDKKGFRATENSHTIANQFLGHMQSLGKILNLFQQDSGAFLASLKERVLSERGISANTIEAMIQERVDARTMKDFAKADQLRLAIVQQGIELRDGTMGTEWDIAFVEKMPDESGTPQ